MRRATVRGAIPAGAAANRGPLIAGAAVVVLLLAFLLFLPPFGLLRGGDNEISSDDPSVGQSTDVPAVPSGLEAVSPLYTLRVQGELAAKPAELRVKLSRAAERGSNINLYTWDGSEYTRVATGTITDDNLSVVGQVDSTPDNVIALRRVEFGYVVAGWLDGNRDVDPQAESAMRWLNPILWAPDAEGDLIRLSNTQGFGGSYRQAPTVKASSAEDVDAILNVLADPELRDFHITTLVDAVVSQNFDGLNVDYRDLTEASRQSFALFITALADELHKESKTLFVTVPFPEVDEGGVVDNGAYDWTALATAADFLNVMPDRDQTTYRTTMGQVFTDAKNDGIDMRKLLLVLSPYSTEQTADGVRLRTLAEAMGTAAQVEVKGNADVSTGDRVTLQAPHISPDLGASGMKWSDDSLTVEFSWPVDGGTRTIWVENQFSAAFKLKLVEVYGLGGITVEDVSLGDPPEINADLWPAILPFLEDGKPTLVKPNPEMMTPEFDADTGVLSGSSSSGVVTWTAPAQDGEAAITLTVGEGTVRMSTELIIDVLPGPGDGGDETPEETPEE